MERAWPRDLYHALQRYSGTHAYADVLEPWLAASGGRLRDDLAPLASYGAWRRERYVFGDLLEIAYALSRVSDVLLLGFQPEPPPGAGLFWAHRLHMDVDWPAITVGQYLQAFTALGMTPVEERGFDPFFHEIVSVAQDEDPDAPIQLTGTVWPCLMLGEMLFSRSGVRIRAGRRHAVAGTADQSQLHEVFLRRYRDTSDGSLGWGHNSQWKTDFRRDYLTDDAYHFNVDAEAEIDGEPRGLSGYAAPLTLTERADLVRHRCLIREPEDPAGNNATPWWRLTVPRP